MYSAAPLLLASILFGGAGSAHADEAASDSLFYRIDTDLTYDDTLDSPAKAALMPAAIEQPRTMGLTRMAMLLEWHAGVSSSFRLVLRPDAGIDRSHGDAPAGETPAGDTDAAEADTGARAYDSRAGSSYRASESISLLDQYQIIFRSGKNLDVELGVFDRLIGDSMVFEPMHEFGLAVRLPRKFAGLRFVSKFLERQENVADVAISTGLQTEVTAFEGNEDRAESWGSYGGRLTTAPEAEDPYKGLALKAHWVPSPLLQVTLLGGMWESAALLAGRKSETFSVVAVGWDLPLYQRWVKMLFAFRYASENWRVEDRPIQGLVQQAASLSSTVQLSQRNRLLLAGHIGRSDRHSEIEVRVADSTSVVIDRNSATPLSGMQFDLGFDSAVGKGLLVALGLSHEVRTIKDASGGEMGAFVSGDNRDDSVQRLGLSVRYQLSGHR